MVDPAAPPAMAILMYHSLDATGSVVSVTAAEFAAHVSGLAQAGYRGISLREAVTHRQVHHAWPEGCVVLTFDDGYANFVEAALPVLARHRFTATVFLVSGHVGRSNDWGPTPAKLGQLPLLSAQQARELVDAGMEIGAHTRHHPDLRGVPAARLDEEITGSRREIEDLLGTAVESFAYPFGCLNPAALAIVTREFRAACTTVLRRAARDPLHLLPRIDMYYLRGQTTLQRLLDGRLDSYLAVRRWGRRARQFWG